MTLDVKAYLDVVKKGYGKAFNGDNDTDLEIRTVEEMPPVDGLILDNPQLEYILDRRFLAWGRMALIYGDKGCGKTSIFFDMAKNVINQGGIVFWVETENAPDFDYMEAQGLSRDKVHYIHPQSLEAATSLIIQLVDNIPVDNETPILICLDSIAGVSTEDEGEQDKLGEQNAPAKHARIMSEFYRRMDNSLEPHKAIFIATNQLKEGFGQSFGLEKPEALIGGKAQRFHSTYQWKVVRKSYIKVKDEHGVERVGGSCHAVTSKRNKLGREGNDQTAEFDIWTVGGCDWYSPLVRNLGDKFRYLVGKSAGYYTWKTPNTEYNYIDDNGAVQTGIIDPEKKYRVDELAVVIKNSPQAKEIIRTAFGVKPLPTQEELVEIQKENKSKRQKLKNKKEDKTL